MAVIVTSLVVGLIVITTSYYSVCRTLSIVGSAGRSKRVSPWPRNSLPSRGLPSDGVTTPPQLSIGVDRCPTLMESRVDGANSSASIVPGVGRSYKPESEGHLFCVTGSQNQPDGVISESTWIVHYQKCDHNDFIDDLLTLEKRNNTSASARRHLYASKQPLTATLSTGSTSSSTGRGLDFSDISLGADITRLQNLHCRSALKKHSVRRERGSLSSASKNSLIMLTAFLLFSLPLIICQVPGTLSRLSAEQRVLALLVCRLVFLLNCPIYPLWYLLFSVRVKKCLTRMAESFLLRFHYQLR